MLIGGYKLEGGIRNRKFWFDTSSVSGYWSTPFYNAVNKWYNTDTFFAFTETSNRNLSQLDFYTYTNTTDGNHGITYHYLTTNMQAAPEIQNWKFAQVRLNKYHLQNSIADYDSGIVAHEIGHACGLEHYGVINVLMHPSAAIRTVTTPQADDINGVNYIYPNGY